MKTVELHGEVRFHLQKGKNFRKWQVKIMQGRKKVEVYYYDPAEYQLEMRGCELVNNLKNAEKVHAAGVKNVTGWIKCEEVMLRKGFFPVLPVHNLEKLHYNPIRDVHWRRESDNGEFHWDGTKYASLITDGRQVYILEEHECIFYGENDPKYDIA
jgi:hypothetical protein